MPEKPLPNVGELAKAMMRMRNRHNAREVVAAFLTYTYTSQNYFYQCEVWDIFQSFLKGLEKPRPEEDEGD